MTRKPAKQLTDFERNPYIALPMVEDLPGKGTGRNYWVVKRTGDYAFDCSLGEGLATLTGKVIARERLADALRAIILDMVKHGVRDGVEVGFLGVITRAAARSW